MRNARQKSPAHPATDLSFMRAKTDAEGGGIDYFAIEAAGDYRSAGNYTEDCRKGRELADEFLTYIGKHPTNGNATLLGCIVVEMIRKQTASGLALGFMAGVNEFSMSMARIVAGERFSLPVGKSNSGENG